MGMNGKSPRKRTPPRKQKGQCKGHRALTGMLKDVRSMGERLGCTERMVRSLASRGLLPSRRLGGRVVFLEKEVTQFLERLPGVSVKEALANVELRS